tara:strand:+ start:3007 stop:3423 length:417 start_codon:yes stop_codon:yes gene_type:complete
MENVPFYDSQVGEFSFSFVANTLTTSFVNKAQVVGDSIMIEDVIVETDTTGLAGATLFQVKKSDTIGNPIVFSQAVANLGASATYDLSTATIKNRSVCAAGTYIGILGTASAGTGTGVARVTIRYRRLYENSSLQPAV